MLGLALGDADSWMASAEVRAKETRVWVDSEGHNTNQLGQLHANLALQFDECNQFLFLGDLSTDLGLEFQEGFGFPTHGWLGPCQQLIVAQLAT